MAAEITQPANALAYCREKAAPPGSNLHYALLFESAEKRARILALFALHYEVTETLTASTDPGVTRIKLNWWLEEIARLVEGNPRHPVTILLKASLDQGQDIPCLQQYLASVEAVASGRLAELNEADWFEFLIQGLGQIFVCASRQATHTVGIEQIHSSGGSILLLELLQNSLPLLSRGYRLFPEELLNRYHLTDDTLLAPADAAIPLFGELIKQIADRLTRDYVVIRKLHTRNSVSILNRLAHALCNEIEADGWLLLRHRIALTPIRKFWIALRTYYLG